MRSFQAAQDFIEAAENAATISDLSDQFTAFIRNVGFEYAACLSLPGVDGSMEDRVHVLTYPPDWAAYYVAEGFHKHDRIFDLTMAEVLPFDWDDPRLRTGLTPIQNRMFEEGKDAGLRYGISIPVHRPSGPPASISVAGPDRDIDPAAGHAVHLASIYLLDAALRLKQEDAMASGMRLTARERECLSWVSLGKSDWSIGEILGIAESTAHFHIERAKAKLGVSSRIQAVVQAFLTNQIVP